ncbi:MAG: hypothetical protein ACK5XN_23930 [Bacteroidota bacterium]
MLYLNLDIKINIKTKCVIVQNSILGSDNLLYTWDGVGYYNLFTDFYYEGNNNYYTFINGQKRYFYYDPFDNAYFSQYSDYNNSDIDIVFVIIFSLIFIAIIISGPVVFFFRPVSFGFGYHSFRSVRR